LVPAPTAHDEFASLQGPIGGRRSREREHLLTKPASDVTERLRADDMPYTSDAFPQSAGISNSRARISPRRYPGDRGRF
jgi:hypothetical protein